MGIGSGVVIAVIGVILLTHAVTLPSSVSSHVAANTLGWILLVAGVVLAILSLLAMRRRRTAVVDRFER